VVEVSLISFWDRIENNWENKKGLLLASLLGLLFYYFGILSIVNDVWKNKLPILSFIIIPSLFLSTLVIFWLVSTNRYFIRTKDYISVGILVICDDEKYKIILKIILKKVILHLNDRHNNVKIRLLPTNICRNETELNNYLKTNNYQYDLLIHLALDGGKFDSIEKIVIKSLGVAFRPIGSTRKVILNNVIDLFQDTNIQVASKDWSYIMENSGIDKQKYIQNLNQIIIFYTGIYSIYTNKHDDALNLLKTIYAPPKDGLIVTIGENNKKSFQLKPIALAQGRIGAMLTELYFYSAIASYQQADLTTAIQKFEELTSLINYHPLLFMQYISMARFSYELGNLEDAKKYTDNADQLIPENINVYLNRAFFAILDNDIKSFCDNYTEMYNRKNTFQLNWIDILEFQQNQQRLIADIDELFKFSTLMIESIFIDNSKLGDFHKLILAYESNPRLAVVADLGKFILIKEGVIKNTFNNKIKSSNSSKSSNKQIKRKHPKKKPR